MLCEVTSISIGMRLDRILLHGACLPCKVPSAARHVVAALELFNLNLFGAKIGGWIGAVHSEAQIWVSAVRSPGLDPPSLSCLLPVALGRCEIFQGQMVVLQQIW